MSDAKLIYSKVDFQKQVLQAIQLLAEPVKATLGPDGLPIVLDRPGQVPLITKDGVTVANHVFVEDPAINAIIQSIKEAAMKTNSIAGDGTTTAILLTESLIKESQAYLQTNTINPQSLGDHLIKVSTMLIEQLSKLAVEINTTDKVHNVAYISCNGDDEIAEIVTKAIDAVGVDGVVSLEEGGIRTALRLEEGFSIQRGFGSLGPHGVCLINAPVAQQVRYETPAIIAYDGVIDDVVDFGRCLNSINCGGQDAIPLVIFAHDFSPQIINIVMINAQQMGLKLLPIKVPKLGSMYSQSNVIDDIAILSGAKVVRPGLSKLSDITNHDSEYLGGAERIIGSRRETIIYNGSGSDAEIQSRADALRVQMKDAPSEFDRDILKERLGRLIGGIAIIEVGAVTELEMKEKKDRIEDALNATRAALEEGVVAGGGSALLFAFQMLCDQQNALVDGVSREEQIAMQIFGKICEASIRQIIYNSGKRSADIVVLELLNKFMEYPNVGYNARANRIEEDMIQAGVIDPFKVVKTALSNAVSIATMLLRSGGSIIIKPSNMKIKDNFYVNEEGQNES